MRKSLSIYDDKEDRFILGEFRSVRELDNGLQLGYFESSECANRLAVMVLYPDGTYFIVERLDGIPAHARPVHSKRRDV